MSAWLIATHAVAAAGVIAMPLGVASDISILALLAAHLGWRWPPPPLAIARNALGFWSLPDIGEAGLTIAPASAYGGWWVDLRLCAPGRAARVLLLRDQLDAHAWRLLKVTMRRERVVPTLS